MGVHDPAVNQVQVPKRGCDSVQQSAEGLRADMGQADATQIQLLMEVRALGQMLQAVSYWEGLQGGLQASGERQTVRSGGQGWQVAGRGGPRGGRGPVCQSPGPL